MPTHMINHAEIISSLIITHGLFDLSEDLSNPIFHGLEIGCLQGEFDRYLLGKFKNLQMTSIDCDPKIEDISNNTIEFEQRFRLIKERSGDVLFTDKQFNFVFIDGDHSYEQTKSDILRFVDCIKPGGFISGHNYDQYCNHPIHPGVKESVDEIFGNRVKFINSDVTWWVSL